MMTKVLLFLGLETVLLNYYLKMKNLELKKKKKELQPVLAIFRGIQCDHN